MKKYTLAAVAAVCLLAIQAQAATFTINFGVGNVLTSSGSNISNTGLFIAVADTTGGGLAGLNTLLASTPTAAGSLWGSDYFVLTLSPKTASGGYFSGAVTGQTLSSPLATGQQVFLLWFPTLTTASTTIGSGTSYGILGGATVNANSVTEGGDNWLIPAGGALVNFAGDDSANGGGLSSNGTPGSDLRAHFTSQVVPEPSTMVLVGLGLLGLVGLRRRS